MIAIDGFTLAGLALKNKTTNENSQSMTDCGNLWQEFEKGGYAEKIPGKTGNEIYAVYHSYEGDHTQPFSYFIGCKVRPGTEVPPGLDVLEVPSETCVKFTAKGKMPDCIAGTWNEIWESDIERNYRCDFEVYDEKSRDWNAAEVDIFISVKGG